MTNDKLNILIADDHPIVRKGLKEILEAEQTLKILCEAEDGEMALLQLQKNKIDIAILDISMPQKDGFDVVRIASEQNMLTDFIMMTMYKDEEMFNTALDLGVKGFVLKENAVNDILQCVRTVAKGHYYISPTISEFMVRRSGRTTSLPRTIGAVDSLTDTEKKVLKLLAEMKSSKEIADTLFISPKTVDNHRQNISHKLNLHGAHALVKFALENKSHF